MKRLPPGGQECRAWLHCPLLLARPAPGQGGVHGQLHTLLSPVDPCWYLGEGVGFGLVGRLRVTSAERLKGTDWTLSPAGQPPCHCECFIWLSSWFSWDACSRVPGCTWNSNSRLGPWGLVSVVADPLVAVGKEVRGQCRGALTVCSITLPCSTASLGLGPQGAAAPAQLFGCQSLRTQQCGHWSGHEVRTVVLAHVPRGICRTSSLPPDPYLLSYLLGSGPGACHC